MSGVLSAVQAPSNLCIAPLEQQHVDRDAPNAVRERPADDALVASVKRGHIPTADRFDTVEGTVVEVRPDRHRRLSHQIFFVQVESTTSPSVQGQLIEVDHDITPGIGALRVPLSVGQDVALRGVLWHNDDNKDGTADRHGIHWTHHADKLSDAGCVAVQGEIYQ